MRFIKGTNKMQNEKKETNIVEEALADAENATNNKAENEAAMGIDESFFEDDASENMPETDTTTELLTKVKELEEENKKLNDQLLRSHAEADNISKRARRDKEENAKYAITNLARELLPVADNLRRALEAITEEQRAIPEVANILTGVEATEREFIRVFESKGIKRILPTEEVFDPNLHEVMFEVANTGKPAGTIVQVIEAGFTINDRLLRPARVAVAKAEN